MFRDRRHSAQYDADGNIILPGDDAPTAKPEPAEEMVLWTNIPDLEDEPSIFEEVDAPVEVLMEVPAAEPGMSAEEYIVKVRDYTRDTLREGVRQYAESIRGTRPIAHDLRHAAKRGASRIWGFLVQPVWVPTRKLEAKQYSRGTLFLMDIVRFGGTFAAIFLFLFTVLNYQSFWDIAAANMTPFLTTPSIGASDSDTDDALQQKLKQASADSDGQKMAGDLLSFLPEVGPPENRIIIPKLHLNVPLVDPSNEALLREDWTQVETDIQNALEDGVVHYPGTAKPGQAGNFFVTGHSSYYPWSPGKYKSVFARLHELKPGDEYWVYSNGDKHRYIVQSKKEVQPSDITVLDQPVDLRISTLMTCTPVGTTLRRLVVVAQEVDPTTGEPMRVGERTEGTTKQTKLEALPI